MYCDDFHSIRYVICFVDCINYSNTLWHCKTNVLWDYYILFFLYYFSILHVLTFFLTSSFLSRSPQSNKRDSLGGSISSTTTSSYPSTISNHTNLPHQRPHSVAIGGSLADSLASSGDLSSHKNKLFDMRLLSESLNGATASAIGISQNTESKSLFTTNNAYWYFGRNVSKVLVMVNEWWTKIFQDVVIAISHLQILEMGILMRHFILLFFYDRYSPIMSSRSSSNLEQMFLWFDMHSNMFSMVKYSHPLKM